MQDITADPFSRTFANQWIAKFDVPKILTTDQGRQFKSLSYSSLRKILDIYRIKTFPYYPASNSLVERPLNSEASPEVPKPCTMN